MPKNPQVSVKVPLRSGFDKSHHSLLTTKVGTITPILVDEIMANSKISLALALSASLPPLAVDTFMKTDVRVEAFFVPMRLLYAGWEDYFCQNAPRIYNNDTSSSANPPFFKEIVPLMPTCSLQGWVPTPYDPTDPNSHDYDPWGYDAVGPGSLADYLGIKGVFTPASGYTAFTTFSLSILPFIAYQLIWDQWYRNTLIQKSAFSKMTNHPANTSGKFYKNFLPSRLPSIAIENLSYASVQGNPANYGSANAAAALSSQEWQDAMADFHPFWKLRQRNFGFDYFTNATPDVAFGGDVSVTVTNGAFTIAQLRAANSIQQFRERNNLAGARYADVLAARYGADLSSGVAQRPVLLGTASYPVYSRGVSVSGANAGVTSSNPFSANAGAQVGQGYASGSDRIIDNFVANEPGYLFVNATLVPKVTYSSGTRRYLRHGLNAITDFANPLLQNVGNQEIFAWELTDGGVTSGVAAGIFGYTDRYAEYMTIEDQVHGLITEGCDLAAFASQRYITGQMNFTISSNFLEIPTDYLDNVTVVSGDLSKYGVWMDCDFKYHVSQPLAEYSIPSLQDPAYEHGQSVTIHRGGFRL